MNKLVVLSLLATLLLGENPHAFSSLGDKIYDNAVLLENIKSIPEFSLMEDKIDAYIKEIEVLKKDGYAVSAKEEGSDKKEYLMLLRSLAKKDAYYIRQIKMSYKTSIKNEESELFVKLINSGLIDIGLYKKEILDYYDKHQDEIEVDGVIKIFLDEKNKKVVRKSLIYKEIQAAKIKRIKEKDKAKKEALEQQLSDEVSQRKYNIRENQKKELSN